MVIQRVQRLAVCLAFLAVLTAIMAMRSRPQFSPNSTPGESASIRFAVIGDFGSGGRSEAAVALLVKSWNPDLIITTGDDNYPAGSALTLDWNIGQFYHEYIYPYKGFYGSGATVNRFFPTLGNHDWMVPGAAPYLDYFTLPGNERYYDFSWGPVHFYALDSIDSEPDGNSVNSRQARWLQAALASASEPWKIVYLHYPPYSSGLAHGSDPTMQWPYKEWGASVVFSGHEHLYERILKDGFPYITIGTGGAGLYNFRNQPVEGGQVRYNQDWGAVKVDASPETIQFQFITEKNVLVDSFTISQPVSIFRKAPKGWINLFGCDSPDSSPSICIFYRIIPEPF